MEIGPRAIALVKSRGVYARRADNGGRDLFANRLFAYGSVLAIQAWMLRGVWENKDLTTGDNLSYFIGASTWASRGVVDFAWSPLYSVFFGSWLFITDDPATATLAHRVVLVGLLAVVVLALVRTLLPPVWAWFAAVWWVVLPIHFDALYEVHLLGALAPLVAALVAARIRSPRGRGIALAILVASVFIVRNEILVTAGLFGLACGVWELRRNRKRSLDVRGLVVAYGLPLVCAVLVIVPFYARAAVKFPELAARFDAKQNLTFCQPFAFGYMQRNPDWDKSPWTDCEELMRENFGVSDLSFLESARRNPEATLEHVAWNLRLVPNGLELLLFNRVGGRTNPDYVHVVVGSRATQAMGLLSLGLVIVAAWRVWPRGRQLWMDVLQPPAWGWVLLGCVVLATVPVILTQRPRPSYLLAAGVAMQAFLALCAYASISTLPLRRWIERGSAVGLVIAVLGIAPIYGPDYVHVLGGHSGQLLTQQVRNLLPLKDHLMVDSPKILAARLGSETCLYVSRRNDCLGFTPASLLADKPTRAKVGDWIALRRVTHIYVDDAMRADRSMSDFLESDAREGAWTRVGGSDASWELLEDSSLRE